MGRAPLRRDPRESGCDTAAPRPQHWSQRTHLVPL